MKIGRLDFASLTRRLRGEGLTLRNGCFTARATSDLPQVARGIADLYADHELIEDREFTDCHVRVVRARGWSRLGSRPMRMIVNGDEWHRTNRSLEYAALEWGMNWFLFRSAHHLVVVHAGCLERNGAALLLPALPGSGKSTLSAALAHSGWRLLSDELALLRPDHGDVLPLARPVCLKGDSLRVIREFAPAAQFGPIGYDSDEKRSVAHLRPPTDAVRRIDETAAPRLVIYPRFAAGGRTTLTPVSKAESFVRLAQSSFNGSVLRRRAFDALKRVFDDVRSFDLVYGDLTDVVPRINELASESALATSRA